MLGKQTIERKLNMKSKNYPSLYNPENHDDRNNGKYSSWSRNELIDEITKLKKRKNMELSGNGKMKLWPNYAEQNYQFYAT